MNLKQRLSKSPMLRPVMGKIKTYRRARRPIGDMWNESLKYEVRQWEERLNGPVDHDESIEKGTKTLQQRTDPALALQPEIASFIDGPVGSTVRILDCGAGPLTYLGKRHEGYVLEIRAADALADEYNQTLMESDIVPIVRTERVDSEQLSQHFEADYFDIACARNTLDHSRDPVRCVQEMLKVVKPGGVVVLMHFQNVAVAEEYMGMHQWNFLVEGQTVTVWRPGTKSDLATAISGIATIERTWDALIPKVGKSLYFVAIRKAS